jgi:hypothetical protein
MYLHDAIVKLLQEKGHPMTTSEIASELNKKGWYQKKNKTAITAYQIHRRTKNYPYLFRREGATVYLASWPDKFSGTPKSTDDKEIKKVQLASQTILPDELTEKVLMNESNFRKAADIDKSVPAYSGLYCIRITNPKKLPVPFSTYLTYYNHNILYIGKATQSLKTRFLGQELRATGHGTFFRGIGAVIGFRPPQGSLVDYKNKNNYEFSKEDAKAIIKWINANLIVNWVYFDADFDGMETYLITKYLPLLNTDKNPIKLKELVALRKECRIIGNTPVK